MKFHFLKTGIQKVDQVFASLFQGLKFLKFTENFQTFEWEGDIEPDTEVIIKHRMGVIPSGYLILRRKGGIVEDGDTAWDRETVSLRNESGSSTSTLYVVFFA